MEIVRAFPPIYADALAKFPAIATMKPIFAWGRRIYNPHGIEVDHHLMAHERVHGMEQHPREGGPGAWWRRYLDDPMFRLEQEIAAYRTQLLSYNLTTKNREVRHRYAFAAAKALSSPMYGSLCTHNEAYRRLTR